MKKKSTHETQKTINAIIKLTERIKREQVELKRLKNLLSVVKDNELTKPEVLPDIDLKEAIMSVFQERKDSILRIDDVVQGIAHKYHFTPDKLTVTNRMNYLADRDHKLERGGKRGRYLLAKKIETPNSMEQGSV